jgi:hypothetical protein
VNKKAFLKVSVAAVAFALVSAIAIARQLGEGYVYGSHDPADPGDPATFDVISGFSPGTGGAQPGDTYVVYNPNTGAFAEYTWTGVSLALASYGCAKVIHTACVAA